MPKKKTVIPQKKKKVAIITNSLRAIMDIIKGNKKPENIKNLTPTFS